MCLLRIVFHMVPSSYIRIHLNPLRIVVCVRACKGCGIVSSLAVNEMSILSLYGANKHMLLRLKLK